MPAQLGAFPFRYSKRRGQQMNAQSFNLISVITLIGGLAIFLYGLKLGSSHLERIAGNRLRYIISRLISNRFKGVAVGILSTVLLQSSSATTVMLVSFASVGLITLLQSISIILGANIGTTVTVQLIAFRVSDYALLMVAGGFLLSLMKKDTRGYRIGGVILAFGFIFFGMKIMSDAVAPLRYYPQVEQALLSVGHNPLLGIILATAFTAIVQSSAATLGLVLSLSFQGLMNLQAAIPFVLGANIGTCITAMLASLGAKTDGKRVAIGHSLFKIIGVIIFYPFIFWVADLIAATTSDVSRQIANFHTFFNVIVAVVFLPFMKPFSLIVVRALPKREPPVSKFGPRYLEKKLLGSPDVALGQATREILRMADIVFQMVNKTMDVYRNNDRDLRKDLVAEDDKVDLLEESITPYLTALSQKELNHQQGEKEVGLLFVTSELEQIGDLVSKKLMVYAQKKIDQPFYFSDEGFKEITAFHAEVVVTLQMAINAFAAWNKDLARQVIERRKNLSIEQNRLHRAHIDRLHQGLKESFDTSTVHLDLIGDLNRINLHASKIAYAVLGKV
jgi:phosphate:Na+ symporter